MSDATQGALDAMVAGVLARKAQASVKLTPVGAERPVAISRTDLTAAIGSLPAATLPGILPADFPWDQPLQNITSVLLAIRRGMAFLEEGCVAIETAAGLRVGGPTVAVSVSQARADAVKAKEVESQARFEAQAPVVVHATESEDGGGFETELEDFTAAYARKAADAQRQAFETVNGLLDGSVPAVVVRESPFNSLPHEAPPQTLPVWACPTHKQSELKTSPRGRQYMACPKCLEFER